MCNLNKRPARGVDINALLNMELPVDAAANWGLRDLVLAAAVGALLLWGVIVALGSRASASPPRLHRPRPQASPPAPAVVQMSPRSAAREFVTLLTLLTRRAQCAGRRWDERTKLLRLGFFPQCLALQYAGGAQR